MCLRGRVWLKPIPAEAIHTNVTLHPEKSICHMLCFSREKRFDTFYDSSTPPHHTHTHTPHACTRAGDTRVFASSVHFSSHAPARSRSSTRRIGGHDRRQCSSRNSAI